MTVEQLTLRVTCMNCGTGILFPVIGLADTEIRGCSIDCSFCGHHNLIPDGTFSDLKQNEPPSTEPRDLKFHAVRPYVPKCDNIRVDNAVPALRGPIEAFVSNLRRLETLLHLPLHAIFFSRVFERAYFTALFEETGNLTEKLPLSQSIHDRANEKLNKLILQCQRNGTVNAVARGGLDMIGPAGGAAIWLGLEAVLIGQITGIWTAFEVLAGDLWQAALNAHPASLANLNALSGGKKGKKFVRLDDLARNRFEVSQKMGTILKSKFNFTILAGIRRAYLCAFREEKIRNAIESESFSVLAAFRNVFVHRAGLVDRDFKNQTSNVPRLSGMEIGKRVPIDGEMVEGVIAPAIDTSVALIELVSKWIVENPQKAVSR